VNYREKAEHVVRTVLNIADPTEAEIVETERALREAAAEAFMVGHAFAAKHACVDQVDDGWPMRVDVDEEAALAEAQRIREGGD
jgi:hypothetical protein